MSPVSLSVQVMVLSRRLRRLGGSQPAERLRLEKRGLRKRRRPRRVRRNDARWVRRFLTSLRCWRVAQNRMVRLGCSSSRTIARPVRDLPGSIIRWGGLDGLLGYGAVQGQVVDAVAVTTMGFALLDQDAGASG